MNPLVEPGREIVSIQVFTLTSTMFLLLTFESSFEILITSVHGEYRLSPLAMPPPEDGSQRLSGFDLCKYVEKFADKFVLGRAKFHFQTEVLNIERDEDGKWNVAVEDLPTKSLRTLTFSRIILATGVSRSISTIFGVTYLDNSTSIIKGCSYPSVPAAISQTAAEKAQFRGIVIHSSQFGPYLDKIRETVKPISCSSDPDDGDTVIVVGGGKSSKELVDTQTHTSGADNNCSAFSMAAQLTLEGRKVAMVFEGTNSFLASAISMPSGMRKGRFVRS